MDPHKRVRRHSGSDVVGRRTGLRGQQRSEGVGGAPALALFVGAFLIGAAHQSRAAINADRAIGRGDNDEALRQLARWSWGYRLIVALLVVATWDMVFKPGL